MIKTLSAISAIVLLFSGQALAAGDPVKGESLYKACVACHALEEGKNKVGPSLYEIYGKGIGSAPGFKYSPLMVEAAKVDGAVWGDESLMAYLQDPSAYLTDLVKANGGEPKGKSRMTYRVRKSEDAADLTAYLKSLSEKP